MINCSGAQDAFCASFYSLIGGSVWRGDPYLELERMVGFKTRLCRSLLKLNLFLSV